MDKKISWIKEIIGGGSAFMSKTLMYETSNYEIFKSLQGNRCVDEKKIKKIMKSITTGKDLKCPVTVNELGEVVNGQHTLEARKRLGLPVYFYIVPSADLKSCISINTSSSNWNLNDYMNSYSYSSSESAKLKDFCIKNKVSASCVGNIIHGNASGKCDFSSANIKDGTFKATDRDYEIAQMVLDCSGEMFTLLGCDGRISMAFRRALFIMMNNDAYDHKKMLRRCKNYKHPFKIMHRVSDILIELSKVYSTSKEIVHFEEYKSIKAAQARDYSKTKTNHITDDRYFRAE